MRLVSTCPAACFPMLNGNEDGASPMPLFRFAHLTSTVSKQIRLVKFIHKLHVLLCIMIKHQHICTQRHWRSPTCCQNNPAQHKGNTSSPHYCLVLLCVTHSGLVYKRRSASNQVWTSLILTHCRLNKRALLFIFCPEAWHFDKSTEDRKF